MVQHTPSVLSVLSSQFSLPIFIRFPKYREHRWKLKKSRSMVVESGCWLATNNHWRQQTDVLIKRVSILNLSFTKSFTSWYFIFLNILLVFEPRLLGQTSIHICQIQLPMLPFIYFFQSGRTSSFLYCMYVFLYGRGGQWVDRRGSWTLSLFL